jgi:hypothetical protein
MDKPYWTTEGQTHRIDTDSIRRACFELVNIFEASVSLARSFEAQEPRPGATCRLRIILFILSILSLPKRKSPRSCSSSALWCAPTTTS